MKKIFYFIASAIVALGAMACQNEVDENITPENTNDVVSFTVAFDEATRIYADQKDGKANFTFEKGDKLYVQPYANGEKGGKYTFNTEDGKTFSCKSADLVNELKTSGNWAMVDSREDGSTYSNLPGIEGVNFYTYADLSKNVTMNFQVALFHFTVPEGVTATLKLTNPNIEPKVFYTDPYTRVSSLDFQPGEYYASASIYKEYKGSTLSYLINGVEAKSITMDFENGKVYNLGYLGAASSWEIMGNGDWGTGTTMYDAGNLIYYAKITTTKENAEIKFKNGGSWYGGAYTLDSWSSLSTSGNNMIIAEVGTYYCYYTDNNRCFISKTKQDNLTFVGLIGSFDGSNWANDVPMYLKGDWFEATVTVEKDAQYKIRKYGDWNSAHGYGTGNGWISAGSDLIQAGGDGNFQIKEAGTYKISINKTFSSTKIEKIQE